MVGAILLWAADYVLSATEVRSCSLPGERLAEDTQNAQALLGNSYLADLAGDLLISSVPQLQQEWTRRGCIAPPENTGEALIQKT